MRVLVTGGAGYIGSHTCLELLNAGFEPLVVDNYSNSSSESIRRVEALTGKKLPCVELDLLDKPSLERVFADFKPEAIVHFAGLKAVGESVEKPLEYYQNNITGTLNLLEAMRNTKETRSFVFSSSATVYGTPERVPVEEHFPLSATNPYGRSKLFIEDILRDYSLAHPEASVALLRYFNPVGAHESGQIGEDPRGIPNNLMPFVSQVAVGRREKLNIFGGDYETPDGTCVRDFIHVVDLAKGHLDALEYSAEHSGVLTVNLGTGNGYSVLDLVKAFGRACGKEIPYEIVERRAGDVPVVYGNPALAKKLIGWEAELGLDRMCEDTWRWQSQNPNGYVED